jgi:hypothetical protein
MYHEMRNEKQDDDGIFFMGFGTFASYFPIVTVVGPLQPTTDAAPPSSATTQSSSPFVAASNCVYQIHGADLCHAVDIFAAANAEQDVHSTRIVA